MPTRSVKQRSTGEYPPDWSAIAFEVKKGGANRIHAVHSISRKIYKKRQGLLKDPVLADFKNGFMAPAVS